MCCRNLSTGAAKLVDHVAQARATVKQYLRSIGFVPASVPDGCRPEIAAFIGPVAGAGWNETIKIVIEDWYFCDAPQVYLDEASPLRAGIAPHIGYGGKLCYQTDGVNVLNAFAPANAVARCLHEVHALLDRLHQDGGAWTRGEIQREFPSYWQPMDEIYSCGIGDCDSPVSMFMDADREPSSLVAKRWVYQDVELARCIINSMGIRDPCSVGDVHVVRADGPLFVGEKGPPKNTLDLMVWLKMHGHKVMRLADALLSSRDFFKRRNPYLFIVGANASCAVQIKLNERAREVYAKKSREFPNRCKSSTFPPFEITRFSVIDASSDFVHDRNKQQTLKGKKICVVGAGAIGGYLSDALARMGAGLGALGKLTIIDRDSMLPENLARHRLGMDSVGKTKATALAIRLKTEIPWLNIQGAVCDVFECLPSLLLTCDLIINATGDEAVSRRINLCQQQSRKSKKQKIAPVLHCWVAGMGDGVQSMWVDASGPDACWECRWHHRENGAIEPRLKLLNEEVRHELVGCKAITPYAVGASMAAAALACEFVSDWLKGKTSPKLRTRVASNANVKRLQDKTYDRLKGCPACSQAN